MSMGTKRTDIRGRTAFAAATLFLGTIVLISVAAASPDPLPALGAREHPAATESNDLVLLDVSFSERTAAVHRELIIKARIWNNSTRELRGVQVSFLDNYYPPGDQRYIGLISNLTIPRNATIEVRAWWLPQVNGMHQIDVKADSTEVIAEVDEGNNELVTEKAVGPAVVEGLALPPISGEFLAAVWPVCAVGLGFAIGVAAHVFRRWALKH